mgnify:CR=1 FL=1
MTKPFTVYRRGGYTNSFPTMEQAMKSANLWPGTVIIVDNRIPRYTLDQGVVYKKEGN